MNQDTRKEKRRLNSDNPHPGDVYIKGHAVYKLLVYNETDQTVLMGTTNEAITIYGNVYVKDLKKRHGLHLCPLSLIEPAVQVFELDEAYTDSSRKKLSRYRSQHTKLYDRLSLDLMMEDVISSPTRKYIPPKEQTEQYPQLQDKVFEVLIPFYCLTKDNLKERYERYSKKLSHLGMKPDPKIEKELEIALLSSKMWPIFYIPERFK